MLFWNYRAWGWSGTVILEQLSSSVALPRISYSKGTYVHMMLDLEMRAEGNEENEIHSNS
jgi:predicted metalloprotease with PDZ domain